MRPETPTNLAVCLAALAIGACDPTLPPAPPHALVEPDVRAAPISVCWVEYAHDTQPGSYGLAGDSDDLHWDVTFSGLVIRHPRGDLVVDVGIAMLPAHDRKAWRAAFGAPGRCVGGP